MIRPDRIGHVVIKVHDLERSRKFYTGVMGLTEMAIMPEIKMAFFASNGRDHHEIAVVEVGANAPEAKAGQIGLNHIAFRMADEARLRDAYGELKANDINIIAVADHGVTKSIYFHDPDGNTLEVYCDNPPEHRAKFANPYAGSEKLDFAKAEMGLRENFRELMK